MPYYRKRGKLWSVTVELPRAPDGSRKQKTLSGFATKKAAVTAAAEFEALGRLPDYTPDKLMTFEQLADSWLQSYAQNHRHTSAVNRLSMVRRLNTILGKENVALINRRKYQDVINTLSKLFTPKRVEDYHITLRMIFNYAMDKEIISAVPYRGVTLPAKEETFETPLPKYLEKDELIRFLEASKELEPPLFEYYHLLSFTGLRPGEAAALLWNDIDFENQTLAVNKTTSRTTGIIGQYVRPPKTKSSRRVIGVDEGTLKILKRLKVRQAEWKLKYPHTEYTEHVFQNINGTLLRYDRAGAPMRKILLELGIDNPGLSPHKLRHTHTSLLAAAGVGLEEIQKRLGHSNDQTTRQIYYHVTKEVRKETADKFASFMKTQ